MKLNDEQRKLVEENHNLIYWYIQKYNLEMSEYYDLLAIALCHSAYRYNPEKGSFSTYFNKVANSHLIKEFEKRNATKRSHIELPLLDINYESSDDVDIVDKIFVDDILDNEYGEIAKLKAEGYTQYEISDMLGVSRRKVSKVMKGVRKEYDGHDR